MKFSRFSFAVGLGLITSQVSLWAQTNAPAAATNAPDGPKMVLVDPDYNFGKISIGQAVFHTFMVSNAGNQLLHIASVTPGCHCTTPGPFSTDIPPGKTGTIPLKFDSTGVHGDFTRSIAVVGNDPVQSRQTLRLQGNVFSAVDVVPQFAYINVMPDDTNAASVLHIFNRTDKPMQLSDIQSANNSFSTELKETKPGMEFELTVRAVPPLHVGNTGGSLTIRTSLTNMPVLNVTLLASLQEAIGTAPTQIVVPWEMTGWVTNLVSFASNKKTPLELSDPKACCDDRIQLSLHALNPGRVYQLSVAFPPGFKAAGAQEAHITVKSNYPEDPLIDIPVRQYPHQPVQPAPGVPRPSFSALPLPAAAHQ